ncbi:WecB/TagA/CpsF family glycosyltransferase [Prosthecobacter vanneervenii]|uniref:Anti-sigma factor antagonist n=1 Tax=Prosthecobacter vanneervenii TaxID=48466 RepID=A0A7W7Y9R8_9BACT|nr:WecB/TagA/CpsF family glycosyltransferase [Prosthecobacter vanneervenii]MBB5032221.1 N-acetylglucosaminyldiphosphoundecaprenol N-acetyl-beta-D-mannosaminyltransferase [Prosthecobacter vanneervenii]
MNTTNAASNPRSGPSLSILGVPFDNVTTGQTLEVIAGMIASRKPHYIATANVDFTALALCDEDLRRILLDAHLVVCDGMPLVWASRWLGNPLPERVAGSDLVPKLLEMAQERNWSVFFLGGQKEVAEMAVRKVREKHPDLRIAGMLSPPFKPLLEMDHASICAQIRSTNPDLLFVSFGCPKQEKWIAMNYLQAGAPVTIGVGATIDFLAGHMKRAPRWMQMIGLEWLYRLLQEPRRLFKRYATDFVVFGLAIVKQWWLTRSGRQKSVTTSTHEIPAAVPVTAPPAPTSSIAEIRSPSRLDAAEVRSIEQSWMSILEGPEEGVVINCAETQFIDSTGLGLLMRVQKRCRQSGKPLMLAAVSPAVLKLLQMTRLSSLFHQASSREEALEKIISSSLMVTHSIPKVEPLHLDWSGAVTTSGADGLWRGALGVMQNAADSRNPVVIDLQGVQVMDSGGLGLMARIKDHASSRHINLRFTNASPVVHESLRHEHMEHLLAS